MPYIYANVEDLEGKPKIGSKHCVALVRHYAGLKQTSEWKEGEKVKGDLTILKGTAIATFVDGKYPNNSTGNHAAFYISQDANGIWVMDQWKDDIQKPTISKRHIKFITNNSRLSNRGDAYSVIE